ncbi:MAG: hypothetical protein AAGI52_17740 [Bacteroidota bacterium]
MRLTVLALSLFVLAGCARTTSPEPDPAAEVEATAAPASTPASETASAATPTPTPEAGSAATTDTPDLTARATLLTYEVQAGNADAYPFTVRMLRNGAAGTTIAFNLDDRNLGMITMSAGARESAPRGMLNNFQDRDYMLTDQTSIWMAREDVRRLKAGETVEIDLGGGPVAFTLDTCEEPFTAGALSYPVCRYTGEGAMIVAQDDDMEPIILDMDTGAFRVTLQSVTPPPTAD